MKPIVASLIEPAKRPHDKNLFHFTSIPYQTTTIKDLVIVTCISQSFYDRLENLIGSIHYYERGLKIIVYDMGLSEWQLSKLNCMENVFVETFNYDIYPLHIHDLNNYAFKALIVKQAIDKYGSIFYSDAGSEFRSTLSSIADNIERNGYFLTQQKSFINSLTHEDTFRYFNVNKNALEYQDHHCSAGLIGINKKNVDFYNNILLPFVNCSLVKECIAPQLSSVTKHRFDQSVLSILIKKNKKYTCSDDERYYGDFGSPM
ncbi:unnamed protein product, partial [Didymodactylos carnosus]